jgi:ADP-heptose:LPS heptosyltransferase
MKKRYPHKSNILLVNITRLGDMLQATPTIAGMKMENPGCKITVLVEKQFEQVCHCIPNIDEVLALDLGMVVRALAREGEGIIDAYEYLTEFVDDLRKRNFDYCLNMSSSAYTALLLQLVGIKQNGGWTSDEEGNRVIESTWAQLFATSVFHQNRQFNSLNLVDVFRCSADVDLHPQHLLIECKDEDVTFATKMVAEAGFTNTGPLISVQAGASQAKRQWAPARFIEFINILINQHNARVVLTGNKKELPIIEIIKNGCNSPNVFVAAAKTSIPQLSALLKISDILVTGDTGPMHISVAVGTPVVSMFVGSAYGYETGPYAEGSIVIQPVIGCGPCNPNKACARPDCHDHIIPKELAQLTAMRLKEDFRTLPAGFVDPNKAIVYRTCFDDYGFYHLQPLNSDESDSLRHYRAAYRNMWLDDLGGFPVPEPKAKSASTLNVMQSSFAGLDEVVKLSEQGTAFIERLVKLVNDPRAPATDLQEVNQGISELDRQIEQTGFHYSPLGPVTRMFVFAKENLSGTEVQDLASQMKQIYADLKRRCVKLSSYYNGTF